MKKTADIIFVGSVKSVDGNGPLSIEATFVPVKLWKGSAGTELKVRTSGGCRVNFEEGESYLVYARRDENGRFITDVCLGTAITSLRIVDIKRLGKPRTIL